MRRLVAPLAVLALAGCGSANEEPSATEKPPAVTSQSKPSPRSERTSPSGTYKEARAVCSAFGPKQVAHEYGGAPNPADAAAAYSEAYVGTARQDAFEGCLDGFGD